MAYNGSFEFVDSYTRSTTKYLELRAADETTALADLATARSAFQNLAVGMQSETLTLRNPIAGVAGGNVAVSATFRARLDDGYIHSYKLKGIPASWINSDGTIDIAAPGLDAILSLYETAGGVLFLSDGQTADAWLGGVLDR